MERVLEIVATPEGIFIIAVTATITAAVSVVWVFVADWLSRRHVAKMKARAAARSPAPVEIAWPTSKVRQALRSHGEGVR